MHCLLSDIAAHPESAEKNARRLVESMALTLQAQVLLTHAPGNVADAFLAGRVDPVTRYMEYGALGDDVDVDTLVERAWGELDACIPPHGTLEVAHGIIFRRVTTIDVDSDHHVVPPCALPITHREQKARSAPCKASRLTASAGTEPYPAFLPGGVGPVRSHAERTSTPERCQTRPGGSSRSHCCPSATPRTIHHFRMLNHCLPLPTFRTITPHSRDL